MRSRAACNLLVFGLGYDSVYWHRMNRSGHTLFLEDNGDWIDSIRSRRAELAIERVAYWTRQRDWRTLHESGTRLSLDLPAAAELCDPDGTVFVHDCERPAEAFWCDLVFGPERLVDQIEGRRKQGWLRQYRAIAPDRILLEPHARPPNR